MGLRLPKHAGDEDATPLSLAAQTGSHSNRLNPDEQVEYYVHERANPETLSPDMIHTATPPPLRNLPANFNGGGSAFRSPEHEVQSCVVQVGNEPVANDAAEGMAQIASQGDAGQTSGSGIEDHGKELKITAAFAYWSGGLSFAASIAIIGARAGSSSDNTKAHAVNIIAIFMVCTFILSVLLLVVMRVLPVDDSSRARARRAFARTTMALILCLLTVAIILGPTLLF